jgi:hydrogenase expression/formation protein HypD
MRYVDEFRNPELAKSLVKKIAELPRRNVKLMMGGGMIAQVSDQTGLRDMLPKEVELIPGPGCPRCVTPASSIDYAIAISELPETIVTIFGGMMMIPGSSKSLETKKAEGGDIRPVYSCPEALNVAVKNPEKNVVFVALGYETTSPTVASTVVEAQRKGVENFYITRGHILFTSVFRALLQGGEARFNGLLLPGPVSTVIGSKAYKFLPERYELPCVITGLEICDILQSIYMLLKQIEEDKPRVEIQYSRCVSEEGNFAAKKVLNEVFEVCDSPLRGFGVIPKSGLKLRKKYEQFDAEKVYKVQVKEAKEPKGCICGEVLRGAVAPSDCQLFGKACTPKRPIGPCMVGPQGACSFHYRSRSFRGLLRRFTKLEG